MSDTSVLITGGTGFAGSHLIEALKEKGYTNIHSTAFGEVHPEISKLLPKENFHHVDLTDLNATTELIKDLKPNHVYHLAAFAFVGDSYAKAPEVFQNNVTLQINVLEAVRQHSPSSRVLIVGSAEEYGISESEDELPITEDHPLRPINPYAVSKVTQDLLAYAYGKSYDLEILRVRPFNHIGERQSEDFVVPAFISQLVRIEKGMQDVIRVGNLDSVRDFTDVKDMVKAYILVMEKGNPTEIYNIGTGEGTHMQELLELMISISSAEPVVEQDPDRMRPADIPVIIADNQRIQHLGWKPEIPIQETLERVFNWYRSSITK